MGKQSYSAGEDRVSVLAQMQSHSAGMQMKDLLGLTVFKLIQQLLIRMIVGMHIAFTIAENPAFRGLLSMFSSTLAAWIPNDGDVLCSWIMKAYYDRKVSLSEDMRAAKSNIHLSFDLWTSANSITFVAIVAHYIDDNAHLKAMLIGLRRVIGSHAGEIIAEQVVQVIQEYGFEKKLGYFVLDNATSNDTCVEAIFNELRPDLIKKERRLRCIGHIINIAAQAFLY